MESNCVCRACAASCYIERMDDVQAVYDKMESCRSISEIKRLRGRMEMVSTQNASL